MTATTETSHLTAVPSDPCTCDEDYYSEGSKTCPLHGRVKVVPFKPRPCPYKASVIETLKDVLADAEAGDVSAVVISYVRTNGAIGSCSSEGETFGLMLGAVTLASYRLCDQTEHDPLCEDPEDPEDGGEPAVVMPVSEAANAAG